MRNLGTPFTPAPPATPHCRHNQDPGHSAELVELTSRGDPVEKRHYHQHTQHHVIVVDQKHKLLLPGGELCGHSEDKILHLHLQKPNRSSK